MLSNPSHLPVPSNLLSTYVTSPHKRKQIKTPKKKKKTQNKQTKTISSWKL
jgi:hypothetical protein